MPTLPCPWQVAPLLASSPPLLLLRPHPLGYNLCLPARLPRWITRAECCGLVDAEKQKEEARQSTENLELKIARDERQGLVLAKQLEIHRESERELEAQV